MSGKPRQIYQAINCIYGLLGRPGFYCSKSLNDCNTMINSNAKLAQLLYTEVVRKNVRGKEMWLKNTAGCNAFVVPKFQTSVDKMRHRKPRQSNYL